MYRCCIFDLDGTLLNTLTALKHTTNETLAAFGYTPLEEAHIRTFVGDGFKTLVKRALLHSGDEKLHNYEEALRVYTREFALHSMDEVCPYDGITALLEYLKDQGIFLAVLSNKPHAQTVENIEMVFGKGYFDYIAGEREGIARKPDPEGIEMILKDLSLPREACLYIGDTNTDMKTGLGAGLDTVGVTWGFRDRQELESFHPQWVVDHPREIEALIRS